MIFTVDCEASRGTEFLILEDIWQLTRMPQPDLPSVETPGHIRCKPAEAG